MHSTSLLRCCVVGVGLAAMIFTGGGDQAWSDPTADEQARKDQYAKYEKDTADHLQAVYTQWRHARSAGEKKRLADNLYDAAIRADRPDVAEEAVAGGPLEARQISPPRHSFDVPLHVIHRFDEITVDPADRVADAPNQSSSKWYDSPIQNRWLARRLTTNALEVWTPVHGWLFDGRGRLLSEARSPVDKPMGRQWYGAFLPDGRWVTTDIEQEHPYPEKSDFSLTFFSREGTRLKTIPSAQLATEDSDGVTLGSGHPAEGNLSGGDLLGWARSNQDGTAWVVNVGSEEGFATVQIGPEGPPRQFFGVERWQACYHHALGPRGDYLDMWVPDDLARVLLARSAAGHGIGVGYPGYWLTVPRRDPMPDELARGKKLCSVPSGSDIFGFWPGRRDVFVGSIREIAERDPRPGQLAPPEENATWFFTADGRFRSWLRGRRLADAADGRAMLFRMEGSHQVVTLYPDLRTARARRFTWADGSTAIALSLFDDLRLGLFIQDEKLVLAGWDGPKS